LILRGLVTHYTACIIDLHTPRTSVHLTVAPAQQLSESGHVGVDEQVHGVVAITPPDSRSMFDVLRRGAPAARTSGCSRAPGSRPHSELPRLYSEVRAVDEGGGAQARRVPWTPQAPAATRGMGGAVIWRARSPTAPERVDRLSEHPASVSSGLPSLAFSVILTSYDRSAA
jgi:hypothetical protein